MALIQLRGKHAVGPHEFALVDDDKFEMLNAYRWKAKPNGGGNNVYAVRNTMIDGVNVTIRMHRVVLGLSRDDPRDVDHLNHNAIDNRRCNLVATTRSANIKNRRFARRGPTTATCKCCGTTVKRVGSPRYAGPIICVGCSKLPRGQLVGSLL